MIEFGMPYLLEMNSLEQCVSLCAELGLSFVELNANFPPCQLQRLNAEYLQELAEENGIYFTFHVEEECDPFAFNPSVREAWLNTMRKTLVFAASMKMPIVNMHFPRGVYITLPDRKVYLYEKYEDEFMRSLAEFRSMCEELLSGTATHLAIENTSGWMPHEQRAIEFLLESPVFGLTLDIGHSHGVEDMDEPFFCEYDDRLIHMHGHDALGRKNHLALGDGEIDLRARFGWAERRKARIVLETKTVAALKTSMEKLKEFVPDFG